MEAVCLDCEDKLTYLSDFVPWHSRAHYVSTGHLFAVKSPKKGIERGALYVVNAYGMWQIYFIANTLNLKSFNTTLNILINLECWKSSVNGLRVGYTPAVLFYVSVFCFFINSSLSHSWLSEANSSFTCKHTIQKYIHTFLFVQRCCWV